MPALAAIDWEAAFEHYVELGWQRRYADVAAHFGVSLTAVKEHARRHDWQRRLERVEREAAKRADRVLVRLVVEQRCRDIERSLAERRG